MKFFKACLLVGLLFIVFIAGVVSNEIKTGVSKSPLVSSSTILDCLSPNPAYAHTHSSNCYIETYNDMYNKAIYLVYNDFCNNSTKFKNSNYQSEALMRWACQQTAEEARIRLEALTHY